MSANVPENYQLIGTLGKTYQLKGGLRFYAEVDDDVVLGLEQVFVEGIGKTEVRSIQQLGQHLIIYLTYALDKESAQTLVNRRVYVHADVLPADQTLELIGMPVFLEGEAFGHAVDIDKGLQDLLVVEARAKEFLIPLEAPYVHIKENGIYLENVPKGLLE
jgi:16S rRNA processing protein RimM